MRDPIRPQAAQECAVALYMSARIEILKNSNKKEKKQHSYECMDRNINSEEI